MQRSNPSESTSLLIRRGIHPLFLRRCIRRDAHQARRYVSPSTGATQSPTAEYYIERIAKKAGTEKKKNSAPNDVASPAKSNDRTKRTTPKTTLTPTPAPPSPPQLMSYNTSPPAPPLSTTSRPRSRSLLAGTLPTPTAAPVSNADSIRRLSEGSSAASVTSTAAAPVVHTPLVKRMKK